MRALILAFALVACGDNTTPEVTPPGPNPDAAMPDTPVAPPTLAPCLDRPDEPLSAPAGSLTCDLLPPGFVAR